MARLSKQEQTRLKHWAKTLYVKDNRLQKEIAEIIGISEKTISNWKTEENWEKLKKSVTLTKEEQLSTLYLQLEELNNFIMSKDEGKRFPNSKEADAQLKLASSIKNLEKELNVSEIIYVSMAFINDLREIDFKKAQEFSEYFDRFIQKKLR